MDDVHPQRIIEHSGVPRVVRLRREVLNHLLEFTVLPIVHMIVNLLSILFDDQLHRGFELALRVNFEHLSLLWLCLSTAVNESTVYERHQLLSHSDYVHLDLGVKKRDLTMLDVQ